MRLWYGCSSRSKPLTLCFCACVQMPMMLLSLPSSRLRVTWLAELGSEMCRWACTTPILNVWMHWTEGHKLQSTCKQLQSTNTAEDPAFVHGESTDSVLEQQHSSTMSNSHHHSAMWRVHLFLYEYKHYKSLCQRQKDNNYTELIYTCCRQSNKGCRIRHTCDVPCHSCMTYNMLAAMGCPCWTSQPTCIIELTASRGREKCFASKR